LSATPPDPLLTDPQRRHLTVTLAQLEDAVHEVMAAVDAPATSGALRAEVDDLPQKFRLRAPRDLEEIQRRIQSLADRFNLGLEPASRFRRVLPILSGSVDRLEDSRSFRLSGYGTVDPGLSAALDPAIDDLQQRLLALAALLDPSEESPK
jgi:uncharacterized protein YceH (UPF0502 family)